jgi:hypothetical protein
MSPLREVCEDEKNKGKKERENHFGWTNSKRFFLQSNKCLCSVMKR